ncbi:neprilysin-2-like [Phymastichus coffea]|uniref:neprilysin-2-like n=1 Tax=Phymastichus coffea TaxID=108790 RepID=UPI00273B602E|nr:neprilysin-2-like [Phymastichus coffea]
MVNGTFDTENQPIKQNPGLRTFTLTERILFVIAICGFCACATLLIGLGVIINHRTSCNKTATDRLQKRDVSSVQPELHNNNIAGNSTTFKAEMCHEFCSSSRCLNEASFFKRYIDEKVNPCDDFYQFACGNFIKTTEIPADMNKIDTFSFTQKNVMNELIDQMKEEIKPDEPNAFAKLKIYYKNCMNISRIQEEGVKDFLEMLTGFGGWPVLLGDKWKEANYSWIETVYKIKDHGFPITFPAYVYVGNDPDNSTNSLINVLNAVTRISRTYLLDGRESKMVMAYYDYMVDIAMLLGANKIAATTELRDVLNFEIELYNIKTPIEQLLDISQVQNPFTIKELSEKYPVIPWLQLINEIFESSNITVNESEIVVLNDVRFIQKLEDLIAKTPKRILANHLIWQAVFDSIDYLPDNFLARKLEFSKVVKGVNKRKERSYLCVKDIMDGFTISLSALYVRKYFNLKLRSSVLEIVAGVKGQFREMLQEVDWMDFETIKAALEKIDAMDVYVAYSEELFDDQKINDHYKELEVNDGNYLSAAFNVSLFYLKQYYSSLRKPVDKNDWTLKKNTAVVNAYYYSTQNLFEIPAGFLREPFFNYERPKYLNYGSIGSVIGHEITHGFDSEGRKIDKNGNQIDWWQADTAEKYLEKARCMIDQYSNYTVKQVNLKLNGNRTIGENIADNGGFKAAYYAYNKWIRQTNTTEPCLKGFNYTPQQMFWISAASNWCRKEKLESLRDNVSQDIHSPAMARVTLSFSNIKEFADDFKCPLGSGMNPVKKCVVW